MFPLMDGTMAPEQQLHENRFHSLSDQKEELQLERTDNESNLAINLPKNISLLEGNLDRYLGPYSPSSGHSSQNLSPSFFSDKLMIISENASQDPQNQHQINSVINSNCNSEENEESSRLLTLLKKEYLDLKDKYWSLLSSYRVCQKERDELKNQFKLLEIDNMILFEKSQELLVSTYGASCIQAFLEMISKENEDENVSKAEEEINWKLESIPNDLIEETKKILTIIDASRNNDRDSSYHLRYNPSSPRSDTTIRLMDAFVEKSRSLMSNLYSSIDNRHSSEGVKTSLLIKDPRELSSLINQDHEKSTVLSSPFQAEEIRSSSKPPPHIHSNDGYEYKVRKGINMDILSMNDWTKHGFIMKMLLKDFLYMLEEIRSAYNILLKNERIDKEKWKTEYEKKSQSIP